MMLGRFFRSKSKTIAAYGATYQRRLEEKAAAARTIYDDARDYHRAHPPGKMATIPTKPLASPADLALAYSPGVAGPCREIAVTPGAARDLTAKGSTVAVISNGTAVLGLGDIGALAAKPVMEGKSALFHKFAGLNSVDLCINESDPEKLAEMIIALEPSFGGVNLEDIKAPDCFTVEEICRSRMKIPVFHDDQHGTAVVVLAALQNALELTGRSLADAKIVTSGAGAAALACVELLLSAGARLDNIILTDRDGVVYRGRRKAMDPRKARLASTTRGRNLADVIKGADVFLGLSVGGVLAPAMVETMAAKPIIFALANPDPEIWPEDAREIAPEAVIATGRSDYPNQVNNVLCYPFLFRGALDCGAVEITEGMKLAAASAIGEMARRPSDPAVRAFYSDETLEFGGQYILPKPFDPRLLPAVASAVADAAAREGVAARPIADLDEYRRELAER